MTKKENSPRTAFRIARITALMVAIYAFFYFLPNLAPERPETLLRRITGDPAPELCHVSSLGFMDVSETRSPLLMRLASTPAKSGEEVTVTIALNRPGGRPVTFDDLDEVHTEKFHLLVVDPSLKDYHHEHPVETAIPGEYRVSFTPNRGGVYRFFADLQPSATGRPLQAVADLEVDGAIGEPSSDPIFETVVEGYRFEMDQPAGGFRAGKPEMVALYVSDVDAGEPVELEPIMGAFAHLVAFDHPRSGFAHMHPVREGVDFELDQTKPTLEFIFHASRAGTYKIWAQVKIDGKERFAPFVIEVL